MLALGYLLCQLSSVCPLFSASRCACETVDASIAVEILDDQPKAIYQASRCRTCGGMAEDNKGVSRWMQCQTTYGGSPDGREASRLVLTRRKNGQEQNQQRTSASHRAPLESSPVTLREPSRQEDLHRSEKTARARNASTCRNRTAVHTLRRRTGLFHSSRYCSPVRPR